MSWNFIHHCFSWLRSEGLFNLLKMSPSLKKIEICENRVIQNHIIGVDHSDSDDDEFDVPDTYADVQLLDVEVLELTRCGLGEEGHG